MNNGTLFDLLKSFAEQKSKNQKFTLLHYLYGYSKLLAMKPDLLKSIVASEKDCAEFEHLMQLVDELNIDVSVLKQGMPLLIAEDVDSKYIDDIMERVKVKDGDTYRIPVDLLFKEIVGSEKFISDVFGKGKTIDDVLQYQKEHCVKKETEEVREAVEETKVESHEETTTQLRFDDLAMQCKNLYNTLREYVHGQDDAIRIFVQGYFQAELKDGIAGGKEAPKGIFLFAGPPGVGKTYLATKAADILRLPVKRFNMSEYSDHQAQLELIGTSKKFSGAKSGALTSYVKENPKSILIFDEIEKAHLNVVHLFLQILDMGALQDSYYEENVSFKDTIVIFTTNVGKKLYEDNKEQNLSLLSQAVILDALENERHPSTGQVLFPAAICSRFATGNVVMLNHLNSQYLLKITEHHFEQCAKAFFDKYGISLTYDEKLSSVFLFHMSSNMDARIISSQSGQFIRNELYEFSRQTLEQIDFGKLEEIRFVVSVPEKDNKITQLFTQQRVEHVLVVGDEQVLAGNTFDQSKIHIHYAKDSEAMEKTLLEKDIRLIIIDPMHGYRNGLERGVFSLEDYDTEGIRCFNIVRTKMSHVPVFLLEAGKQMREVDKNTFQQQGARGVISCLSQEEKSVEEQISNLLNMTYLQERVNELSRQEKILNYNTAQMISTDGKIATIEFYDFKLHTAVKADNKNSVLSDAKKPNVRFTDIIGAKNAQEELRFFIDYLKSPKEFMMRGVKAPKGVLLYGPPGTGKTMLAKAMAGEADVTFLPTAATDFYNKYVGEGEDRIRNLFATAKKYAPSVIFIDEIDAIGKERTGDGSSRSSETLLNALLTEMDGFSFDPHRPIFVLAATNFPLDKASANGKAVIDPALLRRFANKIYVDLPNQEERKEFILKRTATMKNCQLHEDTVDNIAARTTGESLANLQNILDLALRSAEKTGHALTDAHLLNAMEEFYYGEEHKWGRSYYESVAHHEAGHAYICYLSGVKPSFVTIVSRGDFGGYMQSSSEEKTPCYSKEQLLWRIRTALAGRASEIVFYGEESGTNTGVSGDLESATNLVLQMLCRYGMLGNSLLSISPERMMNSPFGMKYMEEAQRILAEEMENTIELIRQGRDKVDALAQSLLEKNQLIGSEVETILQN